MLNFILGCLILFGIGSCTVKEACSPDNQGNVFKWCNDIFEKTEAKK